jgi:hypothetical protein
VAEVVEQVVVRRLRHVVAVDAELAQRAVVAQ